MKNTNLVRDLIYVHIHPDDHFVMSYGIEFHDFVNSLPQPLQHVLMLKHQFDNGDFNMHTLLDYVHQDDLKKLIKDDVYSYGDFCWIDFDDSEGLNELSGEEIAELLYLGHIKKHLNLPFYKKMNNQYVYLSHDDGWFNKTYYRDFDDFYTMLGNVIAIKMDSFKGEKVFFGLRKGKNYPSVPKEVISFLIQKMNEGIAISLEKAVQTRAKIEIPIWVVGDFYNMDEMYEDYEMRTHESPHGKFVYDRKSREWSIVIR